MKQFTNASESAYEDLQRRSQVSCVIFNDCVFPPGTNPHTGRVAFESDAHNGIRIMVDYGGKYIGSQQMLRELFDTGQLQFNDFASLRVFLEGPLKLAFETLASPARISNSFTISANVTDLNEVNKVLSENESSMVSLTSEELVQRLQIEIVGQDAALATLSDVVSRHYAKEKPFRPATIFLLGPTGVGKTKSCETLAKVLSEVGVETEFLRLDMCEYQEAHRVSQLIGSPQGYVGHGDGAQLAQQLARQPRSLILFDEIEKAHPDVFRLLMNAMDAGRLSCPKPINGNYEIDCRQAIFMFTSNLGAETLLTQIETSARPSTAEEIEAKCRQHLIDNRVLPELTGRIQAFALYYPLSHQSRAAAMAIAMQRIASSYGLELQFVEPKVIADFIIADQNNYLGVRPDEYLIDRKLGILFADARKQGIRQIHISHNPLRVVPPPQDPTPSVHQSCVSKGTMQAPNENEDTTLPLQ